MAAPSPATKFNDLLRHALEAVRVPPSEIELKRLDREAAALVRIAPAETFEIRAHLAAARGDHQQTDELYRKAMSFGPGNPRVVARYMVLLGAVARTDDLLAVFKEFWSLIRTDPEVMRAARRALTGNGWWQTAKTVDPELKKMALPTDAISDDFCGIDDDQAKEAEVAEVVGFVKRYLREVDARTESVHTMAIPFENGSSALFFQFVVDRPLEEAADIEWALFAELQKKNFSVERGGGVVIGVCPGNEAADAGF